MQRGFVRSFAASCRVRRVASAVEYAATHPDELWLFAYGSLMWAVPEGVHLMRREPATLHGYARSFCVYSRIYRGTAESPGLVLGLQPATGSSCDGVALQVHDLRSLQLLEAQEMAATGHPVPVYVRCAADIHVHRDSRPRCALAFVANPDASVPPEVSENERAATIASRSGARGPNREYLENTAMQLEAMGVVDPAIVSLRARVSALLQDVT